MKYLPPTSEEVACIVERLRIDHVTFVDICGVDPSVILAKASSPGPSPVEVWNDRHHKVVNLFRVWRDRKTRAVFWKIMEAKDGTVPFFSDAIIQKLLKKEDAAHDEKAVVSVRQSLRFYGRCVHCMKGISGGLLIEMAKYMRSLPPRLDFLQKEPTRSIYFRWMTMQNDCISIGHASRAYNFSPIIQYFDFHDPQAKRYYWDGLMMMLEPGKDVSDNVRLAECAKAIVRSPREIDGLTTIEKFPGSYVQINDALKNAHHKKALW